MRPDNAEERAAVVAEASSWLRTPYHHHGRVKGVGADCAQMPLAVFEAAGIIPPTDVGPYSPQWHLHHSEERYLGWILKFAREIEPATVGLGDFLVWRFGRTFSHGGIVTGVAPLTVVHALARARMVTVDHVALHSELSRRPMRAFSPWGTP